MQDIQTDDDDPFVNVVHSLLRISVIRSKVVIVLLT